MSRIHRTAVSSRRLARHDYSLGHRYYVTLCTQGREPCLASIGEGRVRLTGLGHVVAAEWQRIRALRPGVVLDAWVIMPDHMHAIVQLPATRTVDAGVGLGFHRRPRSLSSLIAQFKATTTRIARERLGWRGGKLWQRNYYDHIVRDQSDLDRIRRYIRANPMRWTIERSRRGGNGGMMR